MSDVILKYRNYCSCICSLLCHTPLHWHVEVLAGTGLFFSSVLFCHLVQIKGEHWGLYSIWSSGDWMGLFVLAYFRTATGNIFEMSHPFTQLNLNTRSCLMPNHNTGLLMSLLSILTGSCPPWSQVEVVHITSLPFNWRLQGLNLELYACKPEALSITHCPFLFPGCMTNQSHAQWHVMAKPRDLVATCCDCVFVSCTAL